MEYTDNIKLATYTKDDPTAWMGAFNNNMEKIDKHVGDMTNSTSVIAGQIKVIGTDVSTLKTDVSELKTDMITTSTSVSAMELEVMELDKREGAHYDALSSQLDAQIELNNTHSVQINVLQSNSRTMRDMIAINTSSINKYHTEFIEYKNVTDSSIDGLEQSSGEVADEIEKLQDDLRDTDAIARKALVDAKSAVNTSSIASSKVNELNDAVQELQESDIEINGKIYALASSATELSSSLETLSQQVSKNRQDIERIDIEMESLDGRVTAIEDAGTSEGLEQRVTALETWEAEAKTNITKAQTTADTANTVAGNVQSQVSGIKSGATLPFSLSVDSYGNYGYIKDGADTVTPFLSPILVDDPETELTSSYSAIGNIEAVYVDEPDVTYYVYAYDMRENNFDTQFYCYSASKVAFKTLDETTDLLSREFGERLASFFDTSRKLLVCTVRFINSARYIGGMVAVRRDGKYYLITTPIIFAKAINDEVYLYTPVPY